MRNRSVLAVVLALGASAVVGASTEAETARSAPASLTLARGTFTDSAKYTGTGAARVTRKEGIRSLRLARDFRADPGSIRLRMYLATDASGRTHVDLGPMAETGAQTFRVPRGVGLGRYRYAIAWCAAVDEPITQARLIPVRRA